MYAKSMIIYVYIYIYIYREREINMLVKSHVLV